jgi:hypothetical protein
MADRSPGLVGASSDTLPALALDDDSSNLGLGTSSIEGLGAHCDADLAGVMMFALTARTALWWIPPAAFVIEGERRAICETSSPHALLQVLSLMGRSRGRLSRHWRCLCAHGVRILLWSLERRSPSATTRRRPAAASAPSASAWTCSSCRTSCSRLPASSPT